MMLLLNRVEKPAMRINKVCGSALMLYAILLVLICSSILVLGDDHAIMPYESQQNKTAGKGSAKCSLDGTKCQYTECAKGKKLPKCAIGFARGVTGGSAGKNFVVTHNGDADDPRKPYPGTLRYVLELAKTTKGGGWITFNRSMVIKPKTKLRVYSNTTVDGRGVQVTISGESVILANVENVILHNFEVKSTKKTDTVHVFNGCRRVWIDHLNSTDGKLGLISIVGGSTDVTISNCYLSNPRFNMLLGAADDFSEDKNMRITVYRNWFDSSMQRMPHCRWGYFHVVNNYYRDWKFYCIGARANAVVLSEKNVFDPGSKLEVTPWFRLYKSDLTPTIKSTGDLLLKNATFHEFVGKKTMSTPESKSKDSSYSVPTAPTKKLADLVTRCAGVLLGPKLDACLEDQSS